jgi:putative addiction module killer protein
MIAARRVEFYVAPDGTIPFLKWLESLSDASIRARVRVRIDRIALGNFGYCTSVGEGVSELKIDAGPGYRVYFGQRGARLVILLCGGTKKHQRRDISLAKECWKEYRGRHA